MVNLLRFIDTPLCGADGGHGCDWTRSPILAPQAAALYNRHRWRSVVRLAAPYVHGNMRGTVMVSMAP
jgi:hypothetical protein